MQAKHLHLSPLLALGISKVWAFHAIRQHCKKKRAVTIPGLRRPPELRSPILVVAAWPWFSRRGGDCGGYWRQGAHRNGLRRLRSCRSPARTVAAEEPGRGVDLAKRQRAPAPRESRRR